MRRTVEICPRCARQICAFCAADGDCEGCREAVANAVACAEGPNGDGEGAAERPAATAHARHSRDVSEGLAGHFNFQPPAPTCDTGNDDGGRDDIFPEHILENLAAILQETGAQIVLSSTWRKRPEWHQGE